MWTDKFFLEARIEVAMFDTMSFFKKTAIQLQSRNIGAQFFVKIAQ